MFKLLEKKIRGLLVQLKNKTITPEESKIGKYLNQLKAIDEPLYEELTKKYIATLKELKEEE